jgi:large subunit ribosomal protein L15
VIEEPDHFGHDAFNSLNRNLVKRWINIKDLDSVFDIHGKADKDGKIVLDLQSLGYDKLLGGGKPLGAYTLRVPKASNSAKEKIESAGGEVVLTVNE